MSLPLSTPPYRHKADHRLPRWNVVGLKSKWLVSIQDEEAIFRVGYNAQWTANGEVWSLQSAGNGSLNVIGQDHRKKYIPNGKKYIELVVAKFVVNQGCWHGYPVNVITDAPPTEIFQMWRVLPGMKKSKITKLNRPR